MKSEHDKSHALVHAEIQDRQNFEKILAEGWRRLDNFWTFLCSSYDMLHYEVNWAVHENLRPQLSLGTSVQLAFALHPQAR